MEGVNGVKILHFLRALEVLENKLYPFSTLKPYLCDKSVYPRIDHKGKYLVLEFGISYMISYFYIRLHARSLENF